MRERQNLHPRKEQPGLIIIKLLDPYNAVRANNVARVSCEIREIGRERERERETFLPRREKVEAKNDIREL